MVTPLLPPPSRLLRVSAHLGPKELDALLDPARYTGLAGRFVDRVVASP